MSKPRRDLTDESSIWGDDGNGLKFPFYAKPNQVGWIVATHQRPNGICLPR